MARWSTIQEMQAAKNASSRWFMIAAIWATLGLFDATQNVIAMRSEGMHHSWTKMFVTLTLEWVPWALATPGVIRLGRRFPPVGLQPAAWSVHLCAIILIAIVTAAWTAGLESWLQPWAPDFSTGPFAHAWFLKSIGGLLPALILYAFILATSYVLDSRARLAAQRTDAARLDEQLSEARLKALQRQMEPHFIFNTLNGIAGLVRERKNEAAVEMIVNLSDFLRKAATEFNQPEVSLDQEVEFLEKYLKIQEARFAGRLRWELLIPQELRRARIPSLILQPLVENAIKHGIAKRAQGGALRIAAVRAADALTLCVFNEGPPVMNGAPGSGADSGIGLSNLRRRLELLHGSEFELLLENQAGGGVKASVTLPYRDS